MPSSKNGMFCMSFSPFLFFKVSDWNMGSSPVFVFMFVIIELFLCWIQPISFVIYSYCDPCFFLCDYCLVEELGLHLYLRVFHLQVMVES